MMKRETTSFFKTKEADDVAPLSIYHNSPRMHFGVFRCHLLGHDGALMGRAKVRHLGGLVEVDRICHKTLVGG